MLLHPPPPSTTYGFMFYVLLCTAIWIIFNYASPPPPPPTYAFVWLCTAIWITFTYAFSFFFLSHPPPPPPPVKTDHSNTFPTQIHFSWRVILLSITLFQLGNEAAFKTDGTFTSSACRSAGQTFKGKLQAKTSLSHHSKNNKNRQCRFLMHMHLVLWE